MAQVFFHEKQSIPSAWRIIIFLAVTLMMAFVFVMVFLTEWETMPKEEKPYLFTLIIGPLGVLLVFFISLEMRITQKAVEFKVLPFRKNFKVIPFSEIADIELTPIKGLKPFKSLGVNKRINRLEYNFGGHHLLVIRKKSGMTLTFSTNKPKELDYFLSNLPEGTVTIRK